MRMNRTPCILAVAVALLSISACTPTFSKQALDQVDRSITFRELQNNPGRYFGKSVLLGGVIIEARNTQGRSFLEVLQRPVSRQGKPLETDQSEGRFLISSSQFLDSAIYYPGRRLSVIGQVTGERTLPLDDMQYRYPVIAAKELRLWEPGSSPQFSFGFGVGIYHGF